MKPSRIIEQVSWDLNDQEPGYEYARWPYSQLATYLQEAVTYAAEALKSEFVEKVVVALEPGDVWQDACRCDEIVRILGETDASGSQILRRLRRTDDDESLLWQGVGTERCSYGAPYRLESYTIDGTSGKTFKVSPPVPASARKTYYVLLECFVPPSVEADADLPDEFGVCVKQWVLWRALALDSENNETVFALAKEHRDTFYKLIVDLRTMKELELRDDQRRGDTGRPAQNGSSG